MVGISRVSTYGIFSADLQNIRRQQQQFAQTSTQLSTGRRHSTLIEYRENISKILVLQQDIGENKTALDRITTADTVLKTYDSTLEALIEKIETVQTLVEEARGFDSDVEPDSYQRWFGQYSEFFDNFLRDVTDLLNKKVGERYIYSGTAYDIRPIEDLSAEPVFADPVPPAYSPAARNAVLSYHRISYLPSPPATDDRFADRQYISFEFSGITYGDTFTHEGFQNAIQGFMSFKTALNRPANDERLAYIDAADVTLEEAKSLLQNLREREGLNRQSLISSEENIRGEVTLQENYLATFTQVNPEDATVELSALRNQIEASYRAIGVKDRLSISDYLF